MVEVTRRARHVSEAAKRIQGMPEAEAAGKERQNGKASVVYLTDDGKDG